MLVRLLLLINILVVMLVSLNGLRSFSLLKTLNRKYQQKTCLYGTGNFGPSIPNRKTHGSFRGFGTVPTDSSSTNISKQKKLQDLIASYQSANPAAQVKSNMNSVGNKADISEGTNTSAELNDTSNNLPNKKVFADTMTFPTEFLIKIVGINDPFFARDIVKLVSSHIGEQTIQYSTKETAGGKYISVSIKPLFHSAEELYSVYDAVALDKRVKFML